MVNYGESIKMEGNHRQMLPVENVEYLSTDEF